MNSSKTTNILLVIIGVLLALLVFVFFQSYQSSKEKQITVTEQDQLGYTTPVKEVYVNKQRDVLPTKEVPQSKTTTQNTSTNNIFTSGNNVTLPITLPAQYITGHTMNIATGADISWPPVIQDSQVPYSCLQGRTATGNTIEKIINNKTYCVTTPFGDSGGMGRSYVTYIYTRKSDSGVGTKSVTFTLVYNTCSFYDNPEKQQCEDIEANFNIDKIIGELL